MNSAHRAEDLLGCRFVVAVTGGIAAGKSAVTDRFQQLGIAVYDADAVAHELVEPGQPAFDEIVALFGQQIVAPTGTLDRTYLRSVVFADSTKRRQLEAILHPRIRAALYTAAQNSSGPYCILAIPLLTEFHSHYLWVDRILVVDVSEETQIQRLLERDRTTEVLAKQIIASQASRTARLAIADDVIENNGKLAQLTAAVDKLHPIYLQLAVMKLVPDQPYPNLPANGLLK